VEIKHQPESNFRYPELLDWGTLLHNTLHWENLGAATTAAAAAAAGSKPACKINEWNWRASFWKRSVRLRRPKIICSPSYADFRSRANAAMWLDLDYMTRGDIGISRKPKTWKRLMSQLQSN
jgi:hypothetical protein